MMFAARILYPVRTLGPGERIGIWFCGCSHGCPGCSNPELWRREERFRVTREQLLQLVRSIAENNPVDGFTLTGGDPMEQPEELAELLPELRRISGDILVYTGYTLEELHSMNSPAVESALRSISVLIDGEYVQERNFGLPLRGSDNQRIICLDGGLHGKYEEYLRQGCGGFAGCGSCAVQNFPAVDGTISVGIHRPDYPGELERRLAEKQLIKCEKAENQEENINDRTGRTETTS